MISVVTFFNTYTSTTNDGNYWKTTKGSRKITTTFADWDALRQWLGESKNHVTWDGEQWCDDDGEQDGYGGEFNLRNTTSVVKNGNIALSYDVTATWWQQTEYATVCFYHKGRKVSIQKATHANA